jgi:hypothetical protein
MHLLKARPLRWKNDKLNLLVALGGTAAVCGNTNAPVEKRDGWRVTDVFWGEKTTANDKSEGGVKSGIMET